jgi:hypothetical protein
MPRVKRDLKEILIENMLVRRVKEAGGVCDKVQTIGRRGFFDRLVVLRGRVIFCETKRPKGGVISAHQANRHKIYKSAGARVAIVLSEADIDRVLRLEI